MTTDSAFFVYKIGIISSATGVFALVSHLHTFSVDNNNWDLYLPFGDAYSQSFAASYPKGVNWLPIDNRFYFYQVET